MRSDGHACPRNPKHRTSSCETHIAVASRNWPRLHKTGRGLLNSPLTIMSSRATRLGARRTEQPDNRENAKRQKRNNACKPAACCGNRTGAGPGDGGKGLRKCGYSRRGVPAAEIASLGLRAEPELNRGGRRGGRQNPKGRNQCEAG